MPIHRECTIKDGEDKCYYQWGNSGKRYWYTPGNKEERKAAKRRAEEQRNAAYAAGYEE